MKLLRIATERYDTTKNKGVHKGFSLFNNPLNVFEEVHVLLPFSPENEQDCIEQEGCCYFHYTPKVGNIFKNIPLLYWVGEVITLFLTWIRLAKKGIQIVKEQNVHGIHTNEALLWYGTLALFISRRANIPFAVSIHGNLENEKYFTSFKSLLIHRIKNHKWIARIIFKRVKLFFAFTDMFANYAIRHGIKKEKIRRFYITLSDIYSIKRERRPDTNYFTLLFVGVLKPVKNVTCLLKASKEAQEKIPNLRLWIVGDGPEKQKLTEIVKTHKIQGVHFLGSLLNEKIPELTAKCDAYVHPSRSEGFCFAILEAQTGGAPIICADIPENKALATNENALLFKDNDSADLAKNILMLYQNKELQKKLSEASLQSAKKYFDAKPLEHNAKVLMELCS